MTTDATEATMSPGITVTAITFSTSARYFVFIETLLLSFLLVLFRQRRPISRPYFASWFVYMLISIGTVCLVSALETQFFVDNTAPLIEAAVPALIGASTVGVAAVAGALLHPSSATFVDLRCCSVHPKWLWVVFGVTILVANAATAFGLADSNPIIALYFACPAIVSLIVVLALRIVVARTLDSKVGSTAMLGGLGVVVVGVIAVSVLHLAFGCGVITARIADEGCPLPEWIDAESVFDCFLAIGMLIVFIGAQKIACEVLDPPLLGTASSRHSLPAVGGRSGRYWRNSVSETLPLLAQQPPPPLQPPPSI